MKKNTKALTGLLLALMVVYANGCGNNNGKTTGNTVNETTNENVHGYVDLGLPSGTLWATCNVGANAPEEYGDYFAWGETKTKQSYWYDNYNYWKTDDSGENKLTKYCGDAEYGYDGYTDALTVLLPEDDAATVNWGSDWCMPTEEQWEELIQHTTTEMKTINGVSGRLFTASNGNSIFLPSASVCQDEPASEFDYGSYWSSSLIGYEPHSAWIYYSYTGEGYYLDDEYYFDESYKDEIMRSFGLSVRPVRSSR